MLLNGPLSAANMYFRNSIRSLNFQFRSKTTDFVDMSPDMGHDEEEKKRVFTVFTWKLNLNFSIHRMYLYSEQVSVSSSFQYKK